MSSSAPRSASVTGVWSSFTSTRRPGLRKKRRSSAPLASASSATNVLSPSASMSRAQSARGGCAGKAPPGRPVIPAGPLRAVSVGSGPARAASEGCARAGPDIRAGGPCAGPLAGRFCGAPTGTSRADHARLLDDPSCSPLIRLPLEGPKVCDQARLPGRGQCREAVTRGPALAIGGEDGLFDRMGAAIVEECREEAQPPERSGAHLGALRVTLHDPVPECPHVVEEEIGEGLDDAIPERGAVARTRDERARVAVGAADLSEEEAADQALQRRPRPRRWREERHEIAEVLDGLESPVVGVGLTAAAL